jgi:hypothetical protein
MLSRLVEPTAFLRAADERRKGWCEPQVNGIDHPSNTQGAQSFQRIQLPRENGQTVLVLPDVVNRAICRIA